MDHRRPPHLAAALLTRYHVELLGLLSLLFILQAGLVPFDFDLGGTGAAHGRALEVVTSRFTFPDVVANLFLFVPFGVFVQWSLSRMLRSGLAALPITLISAAFLSGGMEWLQAFSPSRVCSLIDVICNVIGTAVGAILSVVARWFIPEVMGGVLYEIRERPSAALLKAYCGLLVVTALMPFSFGFDAPRLKKAVRESVFVPFGVSIADREAAEGATAVGDTRTLTILRWKRMKAWGRWALEGASFVVLVWGMRHLFRREYGLSANESTAVAWWLSGLFALTLSALQFPVVTRGCDATDVVFRLLGGLIGGLTHAPRARRVAPLGGQATAACWESRARVCAGAAAIFIVYCGLIPLEFARPEGGVWGPTSASAFLPFMAYFVTRFDLMMTDVMEKVAAYAVLAAALSFGWRRVAGLPIWPRLLRITALTMLLASVIEALQMFIPVRVVSLTDPILAATGCIVGVVLHHRVVSFLQFARSHAVVDGEGRLVSSPPAGHASLPDSLLGSLSEPHPNAPVERVPEVRERPFH